MFAGADVSVSLHRWNHNTIAGMPLDVPAVLAAKLQGRSAIKNSKHSCVRAVIVRQVIDPFCHGIRPVVLGKRCFTTEARSPALFVNACHTEARAGCCLENAVDLNLNCSGSTNCSSFTMGCACSVTHIARA